MCEEDEEDEVVVFTGPTDTEEEEEELLVGLAVTLYPKHSQAELILLDTAASSEAVQAAERYGARSGCCWFSQYEQKVGWLGTTWWKKL